MQRFVAMATEYNVLNLVAVKALASSDDEVFVLADAHARSRDWHTRLAVAIRALPEAPTVYHVRINGASTNALEAASKKATDACERTRTPERVHLLAIGGRKHDMLLLQEMLRRRCDPIGTTLHTISIDRRPFRLRVSCLGAHELRTDEIELGRLEPARRVRLDEVLALHGYRRNPTMGCCIEDGTRSLATLPSPRNDGVAFELGAVRFVRDHLPADLRPLVTEIWWSTEIRPSGGDQVATEFDVLLLACDGSAVHIECKGGAVQGLQRKVFQMRRAFTPESSIILCREVSATDPRSSFLDRRRNVLAAYANLGAFGIIQLDPRANPSKRLSPEVQSPAQELASILRSTWLPPAEGAAPN